MRFAGTRMENFLDMTGPDYDQLATKAAGMRSAERATGTDLAGKVGATGVQAAGAVEAAEIVGAAQAAAAQDQMMGSMFSSLGKIGGAAIGQWGGNSFGGGGGSSDFNATDATTMGMPERQADWLNTPGNFTETVIDGGNIGPTRYGSW